MHQASAMVPPLSTLQQRPINLHHIHFTKIELRLIIHSENFQMSGGKKKTQKKTKKQGVSHGTEAAIAYQHPQI